MQVAFYKGKGNKFNKLIRWWTRSEYSHVELVVGSTWYSSSHTDSGVRSKRITGNLGHWDIYDIPHCEEYALDVYSGAVGDAYDWTGIIGSQILPFGIQWPYAYFCSELVGEMIGIEKPHRYSPGNLYDLLKQHSKLKPLNAVF